MPTTVTQATASSSHVSTHTHQISLQGVSGYMFLLLIIGTIIYLVAFSTTGWTVSGDVHTGLWERCQCSKAYNSKAYFGFMDPERNVVYLVPSFVLCGIFVESWFQASQAMFAIGLIGLLVACVAACIYMCVHSINKNIVIKVITISSFIAVVFMLIGLIVFGSNQSNRGLNWSYAFAAISTIMCLVAGILAVIQMRSAGL